MSRGREFESHRHIQETGYYFTFVCLEFLSCLLQQLLITDKRTILKKERERKLMIICPSKLRLSKNFVLTQHEIYFRPTSKLKSIALSYNLLKI